MQKKFLSSVVSFTLVFGLISSNLSFALANSQTNPQQKDSAPAEQILDAEETKIVSYSFEYANQNATQIPDNSGNGNTAELKNYEQAEIIDSEIYGRSVKALSLKGGPDGGYLQLPAGIFKDTTSATISCWVKMHSQSGYQRIWDFGDNTTSYFYLLTEGGNDGAKGYAAAVTTGGWSKEETVQMGDSLNQDQWIFTTVVYDSAKHTLSLYKDGSLIGRNENISAPLKTFKNSKKNYIGYGQFDNDALGGEIADFNIYNYAMTDEQVQEMCEIPDEDKLASDEQSLDLGDLSQVTEDLILPKSGTYGSTIEWESSHPEIISAQGKVTRPTSEQGTTIVELKALLTYGKASAEKVFPVTVLAHPNDEQTVQHDLEALKLGDLHSVIYNLKLPQKGEWGSTITWQSSHPQVVAADGKVIRPAVGSPEVNVTLTATVTSNQISVKKTFEITVLPKYYIPVIKAVEEVQVTTAAGNVPKLPNQVRAVYTSGSSGLVKVLWPTDIPEENYSSARKFEVTGTIIDTEKEIKATVIVQDSDTSITPKLEAIQQNLSLVDLQGDTILTQNRQRDLNYLLRLDNDRMLYNFRKAFNADTKTDESLGGWDEPNGLLRGHSTGHYLSALALAYASTSASTDTEVIAENKALKEKMDYMVEELSKLQDLSKGKPEEFVTKCTPQNANQKDWSIDPNTWGEGFLSAYSPDQFALLEQKTPYNTIWAPYYTYHKILAGMIDCYTYGGNEEALKVAKGMGDWAYSRLSHVPEDLRNQMWDMYIAGEYGGMNESLSHLYSITKEKKYLETAKMFDNKKFFDNLAKNVDDVQLRHANQHIPQIVGAVAEYAATGDPYYYNVASNFWDMVVGRYAHSIGGVGKGEKFTTPYNQAGSIQGDRNDETCAAYNMLKLTKDLYAYDPNNAKYMDYYERTLLNQIAASQDQEQEDTNAVTYMLPIGPGERKDYSDDYQSFTCCHGTGMENHVKYQEATYFHSKDNSKLYVNLYMPTQLNWKEKGITLTQETEFPSDFSKITVKGNALFELKLRVPEWATQGFTVKVNGETVVKSADPSTYASIKRSWKTGDVIEVSMPFGVHLDRTPDKLDHTTVASIMYGPIVMVGKNSNKNWITLTLSPALIDSIKVDDKNACKDDAVLTTNQLNLVPMYTAYNFAYHTYFKVNIPETSEPEPQPEPKPDKTALQKLYTESKTLNKGNYESSSWNAFENARSKAEAVLNHENATEEEIAQAFAALTRAKLDLKTRSSHGGSSGKSKDKNTTPAPTPVTPTKPLPSDTTQTYHFAGNSVYYYKVTTTEATAPTATSSNPAAVTVRLAKQLPDGYLFEITQTGIGQAIITTKTQSGLSTSFVAVVSSFINVVSDTPYQHQMKPGQIYHFKFTLPDSSAIPVFTQGNGSIVKMLFVRKTGNDYYVKIQAAGTGSTGIYVTIPGQPALKKCVVTVAP